MKVFIDNMDCPACKYFIKSELEWLGLEYTAIELGHIDFPGTIPEDKMNLLAEALRLYGLQLINKHKIIRKVRSAVHEFVQNPEMEAKMKWTEFVSSKTQVSYSLLNLIFKEETGITLDRYLKAKKVERAIELLVYYRLNLTEITYQLNYNSISQLSNQFKSFTGMTPLMYKNYNQLRQEYQRGS